MGNLGTVIPVVGRPPNLSSSFMKREPLFGSRKLSVYTAPWPVDPLAVVGPGPVPARFQP